MSKFLSRKLIAGLGGGIAAVLGADAAGLGEHVQTLLAGLAMVYTAAQALVDALRKEE